MLITLFIIIFAEDFMFVAQFEKVGTMVFKSKIDMWLVIFCFGFSTIAIIPILFIDFNSWDLILPTLLFVFLADLFCNTKYVVSNHILIVKCGSFYRAKYDIKKIKQIEESHTWESAPALSLSRIRILFVDGKSVLISPKDRAQFLDLLYSVNNKIKM